MEEHGTKALCYKCLRVVGYTKDGHGRIGCPRCAGMKKFMDWLLGRKPSSRLVYDKKRRTIVREDGKPLNISAQNSDNF